MIRKYKALGLALVAMFALSAVAAQGASASPLTIETVPVGSTTWIHGEQEGKHKFSTGNGSVECATATFLGNKTVETGGKLSELTIAPIYKECSAFGFAKAHVTSNGCAYTFTTPTLLMPGEVTWSGSGQTHIVCPGGKSFETTVTSLGVSVCTQFVGEQTPTSGHTIGRNVASTNPMHITLETTLEGIHYTGTGGICGDPTTHSDAKYIGNTAVNCYSNEALTKQVGCTFS